MRSGDSDALIVFAAETSESKLVEQAIGIGAFTMVKKPTSGDELRNMLSGLPSARSTALR